MRPPVLVSTIMMSDYCFAYYRQRASMSTENLPTLSAERMHGKKYGETPMAQRALVGAGGGAGVLIFSNHDAVALR